MKKLSLFIALAAFVLPGCFTDSSVSPDFGNQSTNSKQWMEFQNVGSITLDKEVLISQEIDGKKGGVIEYDLQVANLSVYGSLTIPKKSSSGTLDLTALFDNRTTSQKFGPSPFDFNKPLVLTLEYRGVNLKGVEPSQVDFYYIADDGQFYKADYTSITVDPDAGILKVVNAKLNHFSRWGWAKNVLD